MVFKKVPEFITGIQARYSKLDIRIKHLGDTYLSILHISPIANQRHSLAKSSLGATQEQDGIGNFLCSARTVHGSNRDRRLVRVHVWSGHGRINDPWTDAGKKRK